MKFTAEDNNTSKTEIGIKYTFDTAYRKPERKERNRCFNLYLTLIISSGGSYFGYYIACFNPLGSPLLEYIYYIPQNETQTILGNLNLFFALGAMILVFFSGFVTKRLGRINALLLAEVLALVSYAGYSQRNLKVLQATRVLSGIITGINSCIAQLSLKEILNERLVNLGGMIIYISLVSAILTVYSFGMFIDRKTLAENWRLVLLFCLPLTIVRLFSLAYFKMIGIESPKYFFENEPTDAAEVKTVVVLEQIYTQDVVDGIIKEIRDCYEEEQVTKPTYKSLFTKQYRQRLIAALVCNIGQQFSGINFLIFYSTDLFNSISNNGDLITFIMGVANVVIGFAGPKLIHHLGRRKLLSLGSFIQGVAFLLLYLLILFKFYKLLFIVIIFYQMAFDMGLGATTLIFSGDVLPPIGVGFALSVQWLCTGLIGKSVPFFLEL